MVLTRCAVTLALLAFALLALAEPAAGYPFQKSFGPKLVISGTDIYVLETTSSMGAGATDALLAHFGTDGGNSWARSWGTPLEENANAVACDSSGNAVFVGQYAISFPTDLGGYVPTPSFIVKFDAGGNLLWATNLGWTDHTVDLKSVATDSANNIYVTGSTWSWGPQLGDGGYEPFSLVYVAKLAPNGDPLWAKRWNSSYDEQNLGATCVAVNGSDVVVAGTRRNPASWKSDVMILTYDAADGGLLSSRTWELGSDDITAVAAGFHADGSLYVTCGSTGDVSNAYLLKYAPGGELRLAQGWGDLLHQYPTAMAVQGDNVFIVGSTTTSASGGSLDGFTLWFLRDVLKEQSRYHDIAAHADSGFLGIAPLDETAQLHYGVGPADFVHDYLKEQIDGQNWFPVGSESSPAAYDDGECAMTLSEPGGVQVGGMLSQEQFESYLLNNHKFLGFLAIQAKAQVPQALLVADACQGQAPLPVAFDASGSWCDNGTIVTYSWDFDLADGDTYTDAQGPSPYQSHTYLQPGTYQASVKVTTGDGSSSTAFWVVFVD